MQRQIVVLVIDPHAPDIDPHASDIDPHASDIDPHASDIDPHASNIDLHASDIDQDRRANMHVRIMCSNIDLHASGVDQLQNHHATLPIIFAPTPRISIKQHLPSPPTNGNVGPRVCLAACKTAIITFLHTPRLCTSCLAAVVGGGDHHCRLCPTRCAVLTGPRIQPALRQSMLHYIVHRTVVAAAQAGWPRPRSAFLRAQSQPRRRCRRGRLRTCAAAVSRAAECLVTLAGCRARCAHPIPRRRGRAGVPT